MVKATHVLKLGSADERKPYVRGLLAVDAAAGGGGVLRQDGSEKADMAVSVRGGDDRIRICRWFGNARWSRSGATFYRAPTPDTAENLALSCSTSSSWRPWYGSRLVRHLRRLGHMVRVRRLMARMGVPIYQRPRTTVPHPAIFPYLLRNRPAEPGLVRGHHVYSDAAGFSRRGDGLGDAAG